MACTQTLSGIPRDCSTSLGGIVEVLIANVDDVASITVTSNKVTAISMASSAKFHRYVLRRNSGSLNSTYTVNADTGNVFVTSEVLMQFSKMETSKRVEVTALAQADVIAIVKDNNGLYWLVGDADHPLTLSAGDGPTGQNISDRNGYSVTLQSVGPELPVEILTGTGGVDLSTITA